MQILLNGERRELSGPRTVQAPAGPTSAIDARIVAVELNRPLSAGTATPTPSSPRAPRSKSWRSSGRLRSPAVSATRPGNRAACVKLTRDDRSVRHRRPHVRVAAHRRHRQVPVASGHAGRARGLRRRDGDRRRAPRGSGRARATASLLSWIDRRRSSCCRTPPAATRPTTRCARRGSRARRACRTGSSSR